MMRKRERENPCGVCGHYHNHEKGEVCGICGHRPAVMTATAVSSTFPSEILKDFLFLGSYDNACRGEMLRTLGISRVLNTVPACQNLYKNSFMYHCLQDDNILPFDDAFHFLEQCERDKARVLVHCMSGRSRSPTVVIAYLMRSKGWRLDYCLNWVKERRPSVDLLPAVYQQLLDYEQKLFGSHHNFSFGIPKSINPNAAAAIPTQSTSIFDHTSSSGKPGEFVFRAGLMGQQRDSC